VCYFAIEQSLINTLNNDTAILCCEVLSMWDPSDTPSINNDYTTNSKEKKTSNQWICVVCVQKQSMQHVKYTSALASECRPIVQALNMKETETIQKLDTPKDTTYDAPVKTSTTKAPSMWSEYTDEWIHTLTTIAVFCSFLVFVQQVIVLRRVTHLSTKSNGIPCIAIHMIGVYSVDDCGKINQQARH